LIHVAATNPLCAGRHPNLVASPVIADRGPSSVSSVEVIIARERRIIPAGITDAVVDGVMPVVVVVGDYSIPAAIVRLERIMRPALTRIGAGNHDILSGKTERPDIGRMRVADPGFDRLRTLEISACWPLAVCSITQGAIFFAIAAC
jgi:hypothetical protein